MSREAMELALEALSFAATPMAKDRQKVLRAQSALREALAEQKGKQEHLTNNEMRFNWREALAVKKDESSIAAMLDEPPPEWPAIENILDEYGLQAIDFVADFKKALAEQEGKQEPVAYMDVEGERVVTASQKADMPESLQKSFPNALGYIQLPEPFELPTIQRKPLTEEEMYRAIRPFYATDELAQLVLQTSKDEYRAIEAAHGIGDII